MRLISTIVASSSYTCVWLALMWPYPAIPASG